MKSFTVTDAALPKCLTLSLEAKQTLTDLTDRIVRIGDFAGERKFVADDQRMDGLIWKEIESNFMIKPT
ncbi:unnamed protein product [Peronospora destructor]|uniref:Uncharacterized protein n=1 Tax=Peronospora destructor TaxID=86335 RepID=A0AAV0TKU4_9STRA|nr:unnamed protein product [Peronospora destructor]